MLTQHSTRYHIAEDLFFIVSALKKNEFTLCDTVMLIVL